MRKGQLIMRQYRVITVHTRKSRYGFRYIRYIKRISYQFRGQAHLHPGAS